MWLISWAFFAYAGWRRVQMRRRFALPGDDVRDYVTWLCCPMCALCQEGRTLAHNRVDNGIWVGPLPMGPPVQQAFGGPPPPHFAAYAPQQQPQYATLPPGHYPPPPPPPPGPWGPGGAGLPPPPPPPPRPAVPPSLAQPTSGMYVPPSAADVDAK
jgi:hypothetical protein